jgi:hypothetical protein
LKVNQNLSKNDEFFSNYEKFMQASGARNDFRPAPLRWILTSKMRGEPELDASCAER